MKLIKCHIDGFGAFSHRDFDFEDTFTTVLEENGFGKTTLSQFLKAMFYGLMYQELKITLFHGTRLLRRF